MSAEGDGSGRRLEVAKQAARAAGEIQRQHAAKSLKVDRKMSYDIKLEVDRLCEQAIVDRIAQAFPDDTIVAEEGGTRAGGDYRWIVDPLDGTVNYFYGVPYYCTSIACYRGGQEGVDPASPGRLWALGQAVASVVYAPATDELFEAGSEGAVLLNGREVSVRDDDDLAEAMVCVGYGSSDGGRSGLARATAQLSGRVRKMRCLGAAAYDLANVAAGRLTVFYERGLRLWDIAAGGHLVVQAGGVFDAQEYEPGRWRVMAMPASLAADVRDEFIDEG
jgi:fructose-1,6-bisphosphatase/inositol monophosphatase family enzyme